MPARRTTVDEFLAACAPGGGGVADLPPGLELLAGRSHETGLPAPAVVEAVLRLAAAFDAAAPPLSIEVRTPVIAPPHDLLRPELVLRPRRGAFGLGRRGASGRREDHAPETVLLAVLAGEDEGALQRRVWRCAAVGVTEVWTLVPGAGGGCTRYATPRGGRYSERELVLPGERVAPQRLPSVFVAPAPATPEQAALLPPARRAPRGAPSARVVPLSVPGPTRRGRSRTSRRRTR